MPFPRFTHDSSLTAQFAPIVSGDAPGEDNDRKTTTSASRTMLRTASQARREADEMQRMRTVVVGGGTGAPMSIRCLLSLNCQVNAVVAMADDGGSTGELRKQAGVTPPGDVRKCLAAFAAHPEDTFVQAFKYRFPFADNHALGNLLLAALEDASGSFPEAIEICEQLLQARGHVLPSTLTHVELAAQTCEGHIVRGQACACHSSEPLERAWLQATHGNEPIEAYEPALAALRQADCIVLGPGSLFTSIIANLLVPGVVSAIRASHAYVIYVSSLSDMQGETRGFLVKDQVEALFRHGMKGCIDCVLADAPRPYAHSALPQGMRRVSLQASDRHYLKDQGISIIARDFYNAEHPGWHSVPVLRSALAKALAQAARKRSRVSGAGDTAENSFEGNCLAGRHGKAAFPAEGVCVPDMSPLGRKGTVRCDAAGRSLGKRDVR